MDLEFTDKNGQPVLFNHGGIVQGQEQNPPSRWVGLPCSMIKNGREIVQYTLGIDELLWAKWKIPTEELEDSLSNLANSLLRYYDQTGLEISRLSWLQFDSDRMRIIEPDEAVFGSLEAFANSLKAGMWNDRWLSKPNDVSNSALNRASLAENRRFVNQEALPSFELFRKHLTAVARQYNKAKRDNEEAAKFHYEGVYTTAISGEIRCGTRWCSFVFDGFHSETSWRLRIDFGIDGLTNIREKEPDFELVPGIRGTELIWQGNGLSANPEELARYCCDTLREMPIQEVGDIVSSNEPRIRGITVKNVLSFGSQTPAILLTNLNVIIGPNGAGKSNFLSVFKFLACLPNDSLSSFLNREDGALQWIWHGSKRKDDAQIAVDMRQPGSDKLIRYKLSFGVKSKDSSFAISGEEVASSPTEPSLENAPWVLDGSEPPILDGPSRELFFLRKGSTGEMYIAGIPRMEPPRRFRDDESVLSKFDDPEQYPEITYFNRLFSTIRLYADSGFGPNLAPRRPQTLDFRNDVLLEDYSNLAAVLQRVLNVEELKTRFMNLLQEFYADAKDLVIDIHKGFASIEMKERDWTISAKRLSDGTFRWIILLLILLDPAPAPLICLEEPEVGLHPDMIVTLGTLLREASTRTQIIATTHSEILVDSLSETPESIIVCEKQGGTTTLTRLRKDQLAVWLKDYTIGQLWRKGEIGGNRW